MHLKYDYHTKFSNGVFIYVTEMIVISCPGHLFKMKTCFQARVPLPCATMFLLHCCIPILTFCNIYLLTIFVSCCLLRSPPYLHPEKAGVLSCVIHSEVAAAYTGPL